jgi:chromosome segregation ATPase
MDTTMKLINILKDYKIMDANLVALITASVVGTIPNVIIWFLNWRKNKADTNKTNADTKKVDADTSKTSMESADIANNLLQEVAKSLRDHNKFLENLNVNLVVQGKSDTQELVNLRLEIEGLKHTIDELRQQIVYLQQDKVALRQDKANMRTDNNPFISNCPPQDINVTIKKQVTEVNE